MKIKIIGIITILLIIIISVSILVDKQKNLANKQENKEFSMTDKQITFISAAKAGDIEKVKTLLKDGININSTNNYGETALIVAAQNGHTEIVKLLIEKGANTNILGNSFTTALMSASMNGHTEIVKLLISAGANVNLKDSEGDTALDDATFNNNTEIIALLKYAQAKENEIKTSELARVRPPEGYQPKPVNTTPKKEPVDQDKFVTACRWGKVEEVRKFLEMGADVNKSSLGQTPLRNAILGDKPEIVNLLLRYGATVTPYVLQLAENHHNHEIIDLLKNYESNKVEPGMYQEQFIQTMQAAR